MNFTISTDQFSMGDIEKRVSTVISQDLGLADEESANTIAAALVREAAEIAGLSVVKATGGARFVRELIANAVARKVLKRMRMPSAMSSSLWMPSCTGLTIQWRREGPIY